MLRVCFGRKNRTLRAGWLGGRKVLEWVEGCWRGWCALNDIPVDESDAMDVEPSGQEGGREENEDEWDGIMDVDDGGDDNTRQEEGGDDEELPDFFKQAREASKMNETSGKRKKKGKIFELVREKVRKVLEDDTGLADRRARTLDQNDFLRLLLAFNKEGIHFG